MNKDTLNLAVRKGFKNVGMTLQREIDRIVPKINITP